MAIETKEELVARLENIDKETLYFLSKYSEERRRTSSVIATITGIIGSIAGAALLVNYALPHLSEEFLAVAAGVVGSLVAVAAIAARKREDEKLIRELLLRAALTSKNHEESDKRELIERFLKAEGL